MNEDNIILGIDPGTTIMGFGIIKATSKKMSLIQMNELQLKKYENHFLKLQKIFERTQEIIDEFHPDEIAIEAPFFGKNVQSMLKLGRAQGVAFSAALSREVSIAEYAPRKVKKAITGSGSASKEQVAAMVQRTLKLKDDQMPKHLDATDGLAVALCHHFQLISPTMQKGGSGWKAFIKDNPERVKS